jgi:hypothetical protein
MRTTDSSLNRFIRGVYWRLVVVRLVEWAGIGFVLGCAVALVGMLVMRNRPQSPLVVAGILVGIGAMAGLVAAALRRPKVIDAAIEADRQLNLYDLLSTAWQIETAPSTAQDFEQAVLVIARDRAAHLRPREVVLNRLGMRAWGGIGLAGALVLTVGFLTANPLDTQAAFSPLQPGASRNADERTARSTAQGGSRRRPPVIAHDHPRGQDDPLPGAGQATEAPFKTSSGQGTNSQASNPQGAGSGAGRTPPTNTVNRTFDPAGTNSNRTANTGQVASGVGTSSDNPNITPGNNTSTSAGSSSKSAPAPAWQSDSWPQSREAADAAINSGQIPPAYHDLVREYFKR